MGREKVVLKSKGKIYLPKKKMRGGARIYVPSEIVLDSTFPFTETGEVAVEIDKEKGILEIKPLEKEKGK